MAHRNLELLRKAEIDLVKPWIAPGMKVLEIGGGSGYQASVIESWGCHVESLDLAQGEDWPRRYHAVQAYDGEHIPFPDEHFDVVFSSNALEHVESLDILLGEMRRVLKPGGVAVHVLPTPAWRAWTSTAHFHYMLRVFARFVMGRGGARPADGERHAPSVAKAGKALETHGLGYVIKRAISTGPHGVYPNALSELYYFSKYRWMKVFQKTGYEPIDVSSNGLFYTGFGLFPDLSLDTRRLMAKLLGSACRTFVLKKRQDQGQGSAAEVDRRGDRQAIGLQRIA
jgi:SAM-dependent methyltransferase